MRDAAAGGNVLNWKNHQTYFGNLFVELKKRKSIFRSHHNNTRPWKNRETMVPDESDERFGTEESSSIEFRAYLVN